VATTVKETHPAVDVARAFVDAIVWGEHSTVWELLSRAGRDQVLVAGGRGGLDSVMAERIRQGTGTAAEMDDFLSGLIRGLRVDLSAADLEQIEVASEASPTGDGLVRLLLQAPAPFHQDPWCVGSVDLSMVQDEWLVDRLDPRRIKT